MLTMIKWNYTRKCFLLPNYMMSIFANMSNFHLASIAKMASFLHQIHIYMHAYAYWQMYNKVSPQWYFPYFKKFPSMHTVLAFLYNSYVSFSWIPQCITVQSKHYLSTGSCEMIKEHTPSCHVSTAIISCAKFNSNHFTTTWMRAELNIYRFWIMTEKCSWNGSLHILYVPIVWW